MVKKILGYCGNDGQHWVGDGFPVRSLFSYTTLGAHISAFLLLDYAGPYNFEPTKQRLGVGKHPRRGFETVTIVYDGEVEHRYPAGNGGVFVQATSYGWRSQAVGSDRRADRGPRAFRDEQRSRNPPGRRGL